MIYDISYMLDPDLLQDGAPLELHDVLRQRAGLVGEYVVDLTQLLRAMALLYALYKMYNMHIIYIYIYTHTCVYLIREREREREMLVHVLCLFLGEDVVDLTQILGTRRRFRQKARPAH